MTEHLTLAALGVDRDPGTDWHPRSLGNGLLRDLSDDETGAVPSEEPLAAEDSKHSPEDEV